MKNGRVFLRVEVGEMTKVLLGIAVVAFCTFCGYTFAKKYRRRKNFFVKMSAFNEGFLNEISYRKRPLNVFVQSYAQSGEFGAFSAFFMQGLGSATAMEECKNKLAETGCFSSDEQAFIIEYFSSLGKGDSLTQKQYFTAIKSSLNEYMDRAKADYMRYGKLYRKSQILTSQ